MTWMVAEAALDEFGKSIGLDALSVPQNGTVELALDADDVLGLERAGGELLIHRRRRCLYLDDQKVEQALHACHPERSGGLLVQAAQHGDELVFVVRIPTAEVTFGSISSAIAKLGQMHDLVP